MIQILQAVAVKVDETSQETKLNEYVDIHPFIIGEGSCMYVIAMIYSR